MSPDELIRELQTIGKSKVGTDGTWIYFGIAGADGRTVSHTLATGEAAKRLDRVGDAIGFIGLAFLGQRLQVYYRPLKKGTAVIEKLDKIGRNLMAAARERLEINGTLPTDS